MHDKIKVSFVERSKNEQSSGVYRHYGYTTSFFLDTQYVMNQVHDVHNPSLLVREETEDVLNSNYWITFSLFIIVIGFIANRNTAFMTLGCGLLLINLFGEWWRERALQGVSYERNIDQAYVFPGETIELKLRIKNDKPLPLSWLRFYDKVPRPPRSNSRLHQIIGEVVSATTGQFTLRTSHAMQSYEQIERNLTFLMPRRGHYRMGPIHYQSGDLFTLFMIDQWHQDQDWVVVYPHLWSLHELALPAKELFGELTVRRSLFADPIKTQSIRDYQPQDRFRDVHWKATARRGQLQSKVYDPSTGMTVVVFVNVATFAEFWEGHNPEQLDKVVSVAASVANHSAQQKWSVGLMANGTVPMSDQAIKVRPGRAPNQLLKILEALAAIREFPTSPIEHLMHQQSPRLPWSATFVLITAVVTEEMLLGLIQLKRAGRRITLITLTDDPPPSVEGIAIFHIPLAVQETLTTETPSLELNQFGGHSG